MSLMLPFSLDCLDEHSKSDCIVAWKELQALLSSRNTNHWTHHWGCLGKEPRCRCCDIHARMHAHESCRSCSHGYGSAFLYRSLGWAIPVGEREPVIDFEVSKRMVKGRS